MHLVLLLEVNATTTITSTTIILMAIFVVVFVTITRIAVACYHNDHTQCQFAMQEINGLQSRLEQVTARAEAAEAALAKYDDKVAGIQASHQLLHTQICGLSSDLSAARQLAQLVCRLNLI